jgi:hypothetical protein
MSAISPGAALAALRKPKPGICQVCGSAFVALDPRGLYCSNRCKQQAAGARRKARNDHGVKL